MFLLCVLMQHYIVSKYYKQNKSCPTYQNENITVWEFCVGLEENNSSIDVKWVCSQGGVAVLYQRPERRSAAMS